MNDVSKGIYLELEAYYKNKFEGNWSNIASIGDRGRISLNPDVVADVIRTARHVVTFERNIWCYDENLRFYRKSDIVHDDIAFIKKVSGTGQAITSLSREVMYHLERTYSCSEYPFGCECGYIPVENGVVKIDFNTGKVDLINDSSDMTSLWRLPVKFNPKASGSKIRSVLKQCVGNDNIDILYQIPAHAIIAAWTDKKIIGKDNYGRDIIKMDDYVAPFRTFYVMVGPPRSGKSTYMDILKRMFKGIYADTGLDDLSENRFGLSTLEGKVINLKDELKHFKFDDSSRIKTLTGGNWHQIEQKFNQPYTSRITAIHCFACNTLPLVSNYIFNDMAFWERTVLVDFIGKFDINPSFAKELTIDDDMSGFLNDIIEEIIKIHKNGYKLDVCNDTPEKIGSIRERWMLRMSDVAMFIKMFIVESTDDITYTDFAEKYGAWCHKNGVMMQRDPNILLQSIERMGYRIKKQNERTYICNARFLNPQQCSDGSDVSDKEVTMMKREDKRRKEK